MSKAILISIQPKWVAKILNGEKTLEIRKTFPKCDLPIDVYIYCTKGNGIKDFITMYKHDLATDEIGGCYCNGKVVAKFTLNKCEYIYHDFSQPKLQFETDTFPWYELFEKSCVSRDNMEDYLGFGKGFAWHIDDLEIFDNPKEISEFVIDRKIYKQQLYRAPQSWCFVEI